MGVSDLPDSRVGVDPLSEKAGVLEELPQEGSKFFEIELSNVKWILPGGLVTVDVFVWRRHNEKPVGFEHALGFTDELFPIFNMLDRFETNRQVERVLFAQRYIGHRGHDEFKVLALVLLAGMLDCSIVDLETHNGKSRRGKDVCAIAFAGGEIEDALSFSQARGQHVSVQVLVGDRRVFDPRQVSFTRPFQHWRTLRRLTGRRRFPWRECHKPFSRTCPASIRW